MRAVLVALVLFVGPCGGSEAPSDAAPGPDGGSGCACDPGAPGATDFDSRSFQGSCVFPDTLCQEYDANPVACTLTGGSPISLSCLLPQYCASLGGAWTPGVNCTWTYCAMEGEHAATFTIRTYLEDPTRCPSGGP